MHWPDADLIASCMLGCFSDDARTYQEFLGMSVWHWNVALFLSHIPPTRRFAVV
jgi:hypothetical protein